MWVCVLTRLAHILTTAHIETCKSASTDLLMYFDRGVELELEFPGVLVLALSQSLSFEGDSDSGPCLFYLDLRVILLQCI